MRFKSFRCLGRSIAVLAMLAGVVGCSSDNSTVRDFSVRDADNDGDNRVIDTSSDAYQLTWSEEFISNSLDLTKWTAETGYGANGNGWGNNESQLYTDSPDNLKIVADPDNVSNRFLSITARCEPGIAPANCGAVPRDGSITSARIKTEGKFEFKYGKVQARIKVPDGSSTWSAFWLLGANFSSVGWPSSGEIDVMEIHQQNSNNRTAHFAMHWQDSAATSSGNPLGHVYDTRFRSSTDPITNQFHLYEMEWTEDRVLGKIDGVTYFTKSIDPTTMTEFREEFFMLLNVAVDGTLGGAPDAIKTTPQEMLVDWIRVYQIPAGSTTGSGTGSGGSSTSTFDDGLLDNGDFENGIGTWIGNAANVVGGVNTANIATAGNPWDVNLSQVVDITQGQTYTLTFKARSDANRTLVAGIGLNEAPWTSNTQTVNLTSEWDTFELNLSASNFGGSNSRVMFDMGADVGLVLIDEVSLVASSGGSGNASSFDDGLLSDGDFENGVGAWIGNAANPLDDGSGNNSANYANIATAGNPWDVNLSQVVAIETGKTYTLSFKAKADVNRPLIAGIGLNVAPHTNDSQTVSLTTAWQTFNLTLSSASFGDPNSRVLFDMGDATGQVWIDDVALFEVTTGSGSGGGATTGSELLSDGDFENGVGAWVGNAANPLDDGSGSNSANYANIATAGNAWDVNLSQGVAIETGKTYTLSFRAKSDGNRSLLAGIGLNFAPHTNDSQPVNLTTAWQTFTLTLSSASFGDPDSRVLFDMGDATGQVWIDDVSLILN